MDGRKASKQPLNKNHEEYSPLRSGSNYSMERKDKLNMELSNQQNFNNPDEEKNDKDNRRLENEYKRKESLFFSEMIREDNHFKTLEEPLIENYHDIEEMSFREICEISLRLGFISFGGPLAHQELIHSNFVKQNNYLTDKQFKQILNLCLVLPGYSSSTFLATIYLIKTKSLLGGLIGLICFNIPSFIAILLLAIIVKTIKEEIHSEITNYHSNVAYFSHSSNQFFFIIMVLSSGIIQAALGIMIQSAYILCKKLSYSGFQFSILLFSGIIYYFIPNYIFMVIIIIIGGLASALRGDHDYLLDHTLIEIEHSISKIKFKGVFAILIFFAIYAVVYIVDFFYKNIYVFLFESFFRIGSLSFGEGHVIIPMILTEYTGKNLIDEDEILNGYAIVSLLPGSMFNLAAYSGVIVIDIFGGIISNIAIFLPGLLFIIAALPYLEKIKSSHFFQSFIRGANSCSIGFVFTAAINLWIDSCFVNPYSNPIFGTLNVLLCFIFVEIFQILKPYIIIFGAVFTLFLTYIRIFIVGVS